MSYRDDGGIVAEMWANELKGLRKVTFFVKSSTKGVFEYITVRE